MESIDPVSVWDEGFEAGLVSSFCNPKNATLEMRRLYQHGFISAGKCAAMFRVPRVTEHTHQAALFAWAGMAAPLRRELRLLFAIPNGGKRTNGARLVAEGMRAGVPDVCLPIPRYGSGALFIEMKMPKGRVSPEQAVWLQDLEDFGNTALACYGFDHARTAIKEYLSGELND